MVFRSGAEGCTFAFTVAMVISALCSSGLRFETSLVSLALGFDCSFSLCVFLCPAVSSGCLFSVPLLPF